MKRQKIYHTREMIVKDIDAAIRRMKRLRRKAMDHDEAASVFLQMDNSVAFIIEKDASAKLWAQAGRIENTRLKKLGATLAMWDTKPFSVTPEEQVVLQKCEAICGASLALDSQVAQVAAVSPLLTDNTSG